MKTRQVAVIDEHELFRLGVVAIIQQDRYLEVVHEAADGPLRAHADVVIASPTAVRLLRPSGPVVVPWGPGDPPLFDASAFPATIVERDTVSAEELLAAVRALAAGFAIERRDDGSPVDSLDHRRRHILRLLSEGADTRGISESLYYSERTVKGLIHDIEEQLRARNRTEAVAKGIRLGLI